MPTIVEQAEPEEARTETPTFRATKTEDARIKRAAKKTGHKPAVFMRLAVMAAVVSVEKAVPAKRAARKAAR